MGENVLVGPLQGLQIRHGVVGVARCHRDTRNHSVVTVHRLVDEVMRSLRLARALYLA